MRAVKHLSGVITRGYKSVKVKATENSGRD